jgi:uncharacterized protein HemX
MAACVYAQYPYTEVNVQESERTAWYFSSPGWGQVIVIIIGIGAASFMMQQAQVRQLKDENAALRQQQTELYSNQRDLGRDFDLVMGILTKGDYKPRWK